MKIVAKKPTKTATKNSDYNSTQFFPSSLSYGLTVTTALLFLLTQPIEKSSAKSVLVSSVIKKRVTREAIDGNTPAEDYFGNPIISGTTSTTDNSADDYYNNAVISSSMNDGLEDSSQTSSQSTPGPLPNQLSDANLFPTNLATRKPATQQNRGLIFEPDPIEGVEDEDEEEEDQKQVPTTTLEPLPEEEQLGQDDEDPEEAEREEIDFEVDADEAPTTTLEPLSADERADEEDIEEDIIDDDLEDDIIDDDDLGDDAQIDSDQRRSSTMTGKRRQNGGGFEISDSGAIQNFVQTSFRGGGGRRSGGCRDYDPWVCRRFSIRGEACSRDWELLYCAASCNACPPEAGCSDSSMICPQLQKWMHDCDHDGVMARVCRRTCGTCDNMDKK